MNILITNDDGYGAEGIVELSRVLRKNHTVWIVAPAENRSGASSSIIMSKYQSFEKKSDNEYSLDGSPADCVICAVKSNIFPSKPDVVLSGINKYGNLGTDVIYSGTCAAARQAAIYGIPGIALSVEPDSSKEVFNYTALAEFVDKNLTTLLEYCTPNRFLNINAPSVSSFSGIKFASLSKRLYKDKVNIIQKNDDKLYSICTGDMKIPFTGDDCNDNLLVNNGYIAISAIYAEPVADVSLCTKSTSQFVL